MVVRRATPPALAVSALAPDRPPPAATGSRSCRCPAAQPAGMRGGGTAIERRPHPSSSSDRPARHVDSHAPTQRPPAPAAPSHPAYARRRPVSVGVLVRWPRPVLRGDDHNVGVRRWCGGSQRVVSVGEAFLELQVSAPPPSLETGPRGTGASGGEQQRIVGRRRGCQSADAGLPAA